MEGLLTYAPNSWRLAVELCGIHDGNQDLDTNIFVSTSLPRGYKKSNRDGESGPSIWIEG